MIRTYATVFGALLVLTGVTVLASRVNLGPLNTALALSIAGGKGFLVAAYFMHLRGGSRLTWVVAGGGFAWLLILIALTMSDYLTRGWAEGAAEFGE